LYRATGSQQNHHPYKKKSFHNFINLTFAAKVDIISWTDKTSVLNIKSGFTFIQENILIFAAKLLKQIKKNIKEWFRGKK
jgi:hypothetical protein